MRIIILCVLLLATLAHALTVGHPLKYVLYKQCDPRWGNDEMGAVGDGERNTICHEGCAMSCVTMVMATLGAKTSDDKPLNPGTFNKWLIENNGYLCAGGDCNNLNLTAPDRRFDKLHFIAEEEKGSFEDISKGLAEGKTAYIAHVCNKGHFVLLTGPAPDRKSFYVNDPYYSQYTYPYANISDIITYRLK